MRRNTFALFLALVVALPGLGDPAMAGDEPFESYDNFRVVGVFPSKPLSSVVIRATGEYQWGAGPLWDDECKSLVPGAVMKFLGDGRFRLEFGLLPGGYRHSQAVLACRFVTPWEDGEGELYFEIESSDVMKGKPADRVDLCITQWDDHNRAGIVRSTSLCGDANRNGRVDISDPLVILRAAVDLTPCSPLRCDADGSGTVTIEDALRTLKSSVGLARKMLCGCF